MELRQLRYFIAIAETRSLTGAAERLHVAQPALSQNIKSMESELGVALFTRSRQGMKMTDSGEVFLEHAYTVMRQVDCARASVKDAENSPSGTVALAMPASVSKVLTIPMYQRLQARYPNIVLHHEEGLVGNLRKLFDTGYLDLMIDTEPERLDGVSVEPLLEEELYLVQAYDTGLSLPLEIELNSLSGLPVYALSTKHGMGRVVDQYFRKYGVELNNLPHQLGLHSMLQLVCEGRGRVILPWSAIYDLVENKQLFAQRIINPFMYRPVSILIPTVKPRTNAVSKVVDLLQEAVVQVHSEGKWRGKLCIQPTNTPS